MPLPLSQKKRVNQRAWACARAAFKRYRAELADAIITGAVSIDQVDTWRPGDWRVDPMDV